MCLTPSVPSVIKSHLCYIIKWGWLRIAERHYLYKVICRRAKGYVVFWDVGTHEIGDAYSSWGGELCDSPGFWEWWIQIGGSGGERLGIEGSGNVSWMDEDSTHFFSCCKEGSHMASPHVTVSCQGPTGQTPGLKGSKQMVGTFKKTYTQACATSVTRCIIKVPFWFFWVPIMNPARDANRSRNSLPKCHCLQWSVYFYNKWDLVSEAELPPENDMWALVGSPWILFLQ